MQFTGGCPRLRPRHNFNLFVREVQGRFQQGGQVFGSFGQVVQFTAAQAHQPARRRPGFGFGRCADHARHGFGRVQRKPPRQIRPPGELARLGDPGAGRGGRGQNIAGQGRRGVQVQFGDVFARIRARRAHDVTAPRKFGRAAFDGRNFHMEPTGHVPVAGQFT